MFRQKGRDFLRKCSHIDHRHNYERGLPWSSHLLLPVHAQNTEITQYFSLALLFSAFSNLAVNGRDFGVTEQTSPTTTAQPSDGRITFILTKSCISPKYPLRAFIYLFIYDRNDETGGRPAPVWGSGGDVLRLWLGNGLRWRLGPTWCSGSVSPNGLWNGAGGSGWGLLWTRQRDNPDGQS